MLDEPQFYLFQDDVFEGCIMVLGMFTSHLLGPFASIQTLGTLLMKGYSNRIMLHICLILFIGRIQWLLLFLWCRCVLLTYFIFMYLNFLYIFSKNDKIQKRNFGQFIGFLRIYGIVVYVGWNRYEWVLVVNEQIVMNEWIMNLIG